MTLADYIGIPFEEHGRSHRGVDCYGLVMLVMFEVYGVTTRDYTDYRSARPRDCADLFRGAQREMEWVKVPNPVEGDVVLLNILGMPAHCGLYLGNGEFIHASHAAGVCRDRLAAPLWARRIAGYFRHRERMNGQ